MDDDDDDDETADDDEGDDGGKVGMLMTEQAWAPLLERRALPQ